MDNAICVRVQPVRLTDGSLAYNVHLPEMVLHATTEHGARKIGEWLEKIVDRYTVDEIEIGDDFETKDQ
jgi:hypothetical protein